MTDQMKVEMMSIKARLLKLSDFTEGSKKPIVAELKTRLVTELNRHKLKLEHLLSETDEKYEKCSLLHILLMLETIYSGFYTEEGPWGNEVRTFSEDYERYLKMGMKVAPEDIGFNFR